MSKGNLHQNQYHPSAYAHETSTISDSQEAAASLSAPLPQPPSGYAGEVRSTDNHAGTNNEILITLRDLTLTLSRHPPKFTWLPYALPYLREQRITQTIFRDVSLSFGPGLVHGILGASGSGKTSLLNCLSGRIHPSEKPSVSLWSRFLSTPQVSLTGQLDIQPSTAKICYVTQQDFLMPYLTVRETLTYAARLQASHGSTEIARQVEEIIVELGLVDCADVLIGDTRVRGCSGGQRRRVSIGVQMLTNPAILILDEPTSGLDAFTAKTIVETLHFLARKRGTMVVVTVHQPRSQIFSLLDTVTLVSSGRVVYSGSQPIAYFSSIGYTCPTDVNPADYLLDLVAVDFRSSSASAKSKELIHKFADDFGAFQRCQMAADDAAAPPGVSAGGSSHTARSIDYPSSLFIQIKTLTSRTFTNLRRDRISLLGCFFEALIMSLVTGFLFLNLDSTLSGIQSRIGLIYISSSIHPYLIIVYSVYRIAYTIPSFDRDRQDKLYSPFAYLASQLVAYSPFDVFFPVMFGVIIYFMTGLRTDGAGAWHFWVWTYVMVLNQYISIWLASFCVAVIRDYPTASLMSNSLVTFAGLSCGFFVQIDTVPVYLSWIKHISFVYYPFRLLITNEFTDQDFPCPLPDPNNPVCQQYQGKFVLQNLGFQPNEYAYYMVGLAIMLVVLMLMTWVAMSLIKIDFLVIASSPTSSHGHSQTPEQDPSWLSADLTTDGPCVVACEQPPVIGIQIKNLRLVVHKRIVLTSTQTVLLNNVSATFLPGKVNVILGESGSGKTTLLKQIARRNNFTSFNVRGEITFGKYGQVYGENLKNILAFVDQDDDALLLPSLSVRETLLYAARLRLPGNSISRESLERRVDSLIRSLGLQQCREHIVGDERHKGISGGERKRVAIAIQMLKQPRILVLDEPTSGLDTFTAHHLMLLLRDLADREGTTILCTLHQPRSDIFPMMDSVLVLAKGGSPIYSGPATQMLQYFQQQNLHCPAGTNPTDFVLDIAACDQRNPSADKLTRERVAMLIQSFHQRFDDKQLPGDPVDSKEQIEQLPVVIYRPYQLFSVRTTSILVSRTLTNMARQPLMIFSRLGQLLAYALILTIFFAPLPEDQAGYRNRFGVMQECLAFLFVGMLNNVVAYPSERNLFYSEHKDNSYHTLPFVLSYMSHEVPVEIISALIVAALLSFVVGMFSTVTGYFSLVLIIFVCANAGESIGIIFCSIVYTVGFSINLTSTILSLAMLTAGFLSLDPPAFFPAINHISLLNYLAPLLTDIVFEDTTFACTESQRLSNGVCPISTGADAMRLYGFDPDNINKPLNFCLIVVVAIAYRLIAVLAVKLRVDGPPSFLKRLSVASLKKPDDSTDPAAVEAMPPPSLVRAGITRTVPYWWGAPDAILANTPRLSSLIFIKIQPSTLIRRPLPVRQAPTSVVDRDGIYQSHPSSSLLLAGGVLSSR
ncbi:P-loop containing nucleoside triphosphate hydrolase protein [Basidiobolus meristosporus CBS 931.73]|uniref:p-loop containing nucleoside triphosphate hydrolase protein n=1 Tax=Basidiobolus meristosporus CBS 931.73 TaxID=1314790 RepID=A0A1Y1XJZ6_9FUNG|nr:P-loop containing nucleoside triphosphate hydrolase protein [Basidiobolus meristosporus CBS 931.73]|eukprot:ORX86087.1 P-loop containing nucleoside triphosphate hydrolase protein [Basidiobolus meristosporus CBS 931.73]